MPSATYPFDATGTATTNLVSQETHQVQEFNYRSSFLIIPEAAPFYIDNLIVRYNNGTVIKELIRDVDYKLVFDYRAATQSIGKPVYGGILLNIFSTGTISIDYQTIGGTWTCDRNYVLQKLVQNEFNPRVTIWDMITDKTDLFPPINHQQTIDTIYGMDKLIAQLVALETAILTGFQNQTPLNIVAKTSEGLQYASLDSNGKMPWTQLPTFANVATSGNYDDLSNRPVLSTVALTGSFDDLSDKESYMGKIIQSPIYFAIDGAQVKDYTSIDGNMGFLKTGLSPYIHGCPFNIFILNPNYTGVTPVVVGDGFVKIVGTTRVETIYIKKNSFVDASDLANGVDKIYLPGASNTYKILKTTNPASSAYIYKTYPDGRLEGTLVTDGDTVVFSNGYIGVATLMTLNNGTINATVNTNEKTPSDYTPMLDQFSMQVEIPFNTNMIFADGSYFIKNLFPVHYAITRGQYGQSTDADTNITFATPALDSTDKTDVPNSGVPGVYTYFRP